MMGKFKKVFQKIFFPDNGTCPICGKVLLSERNYLCGSCKTALPPVRLASCKHCGRPMAGAERCKNCLGAKDKVQDGGCVWLEYTGSAAKMIAEMKFHNRRGLCRYAGTEVAQVLKEMPWLKEIDVIFPVPLHANRMSERGYNQSRLIAEGISLSLQEHWHLNLPVVDGLVRVVDTPHQIGQGRDRRLEFPENAFDVKPESLPAEKNILVVDDVITTGATLRACTATLKAAGAGKVYTACVAGVMDWHA